MVVTWDDISEYISIAKIENPTYDITQDIDLRAKIYVHLCKCIPYIGNGYIDDCVKSYEIRQYSNRSEFLFHSTISNYFYNELGYMKRNVVNILGGYLKQTFNLKFDIIW